MTIKDAIDLLRKRGHEVTSDFPGLFDISGIGRDLTVNQVIYVASRLAS